MQYTSLIGNTAKYPYLVGVYTGRSLGSGILLGCQFVLTCYHTEDHEDPLEVATDVSVISSSGSINAIVKWSDARVDLALLVLDRKLQALQPRFGEAPLSEGEVLMAAGVQASADCDGTLTVAEIKLKYMNTNEAGGEALDFQFEGGARPGYSGGPVLLEQDGVAHCIGLIRLGQDWSSFSNAVGLAIMRAFLEKHLPENALLTHPEDVRGLELRRLEEAAISGDTEAQYRWARLHADQHGERHQPEIAARWLREAAERGHAECAYQLALAYREGNGVLPSESEALRWFRAAAELGNSNGQTVLGRMLLDGTAGYKDAAEAARMLERASVQDNPDAQFQLAMLYFHGALGVAQDDAKSFRLLRQVAPSGLPAAQYYLALMYARGRGTPANSAEALRWARTALNQQYEAARPLVRALSRG